LQVTQALLKELRQEAPDEATLQQVRRGILNRYPDEASPMVFPPVWRFALGTAVVAILILAVVVFRHPSRTPVPEVVGKKEAALQAVRQTPTLPPPAPAQSPTRPHVERIRNSHSVSQQGSEALQHPEPLTVKLITDNPNVVIYWQVD
jgi:hypothetical protein